ncbi:unnamed protein product [Bursaphelenchus okinawaensis]|uniref:Uncharacterized protein n=1 Tax=Bursaphelenchus okinawaensis TaxID=465554 RepID=A0A811KLM7_9BILA|nr:unnamed protein product [Bursaphelenchus okinawaensis]CAG9107482.1 unnamed protein product [Bursaphelenchus okinawaensis]
MDRKAASSTRSTSQFPDILKRFRSLRSPDKLNRESKEEKENTDPIKPDNRPGSSTRRLERLKPRSKSCLKPVTRFVTKISKRYSPDTESTSEGGLFNGIF